MAKVSKVGELRVYRRLVKLHLQVHQISLTFPQFEMYELGSQVRRPSNSAPANLAEGFNNKHKNIYLECISRSLGEIRGTQHHLMIAWKNGICPRTSTTNWWKSTTSAAGCSAPLSAASRPRPHQSESLTSNLSPLTHVRV